MNLGLVFLTGLSVGGLTCLAVQGGLLASVIASQKKENAFGSTVVFLVTKLIAYTILGLILGGFGSVIGVNQTVGTVVQLVAGIYMIVVALNLLEVHPIFRYAIVQPPKFLARRVRGAATPALLGALTVFIPCGTTLAMEALAISSGSAVMGALILGIFVLGTSPLFFGIGYLTNILGDGFKGKFLKIAAVIVLYLGLSSVNGALVASGVNIFPKQKSSEVAVTQDVVIEVMAYGYKPDYIRVKKDMPVNVTLVGKGGYSCASAFRIPSLGISKNLQATEKYTFSFTPTKLGKIPFTCSMGMYTGVIEVI